MARTMNVDGQCYRAGIEYVNDSDPSEVCVHYFGPYDEPGKAKASRTRWKKQRYNYRGRTFIREFVEVSDTWREL